MSNSSHEEEAANMKAISPVRSVRNNMSNSSEHILGISRSKSPLDDPLSLLYNMNDCYSTLKELVPSLPQNKNVSKMEILQHVIDYILDLQIALDSSPSFVTSSCQHQQQRLGQTASRSPLLATVGSGSILTYESNDLPKETEQDVDSSTVLRWLCVQNNDPTFPPLAAGFFTLFLPLLKGAIMWCCLKHRFCPLAYLFVRTEENVSFRHDWDHRNWLRRLLKRDLSPERTLWGRCEDFCFSLWNSGKDNRKVIQYVHCSEGLWSCTNCV